MGMISIPQVAEDAEEHLVSNVRVSWETSDISLSSSTAAASLLSRKACSNISTCQLEIGRFLMLVKQ